MSDLTSWRPSAARRRGFTMLELLVTVTIIIILLGMIFPVLNMIRRQQKKLETRGVMDNITVALTMYFETYPVLGDDGASGPPDATSSKFVDSPWTYLGHNRIEAGLTPYLDPRAKYLATGPAAGPFGPGTREKADQICDAFLIADHSNHFYWSITNAQGSGSTTFNYTDIIWMRSAVGTPADPKDDLIQRFTLKNGQWQPMTYAEAIAEAVPPPATFWQP